MAEVEEFKLDERLEKFLDADLIEEKIAIAKTFKFDVTDFDIDTMASCLDATITPGKPSDRLQELLDVLRLKQKYEVRR